MRPVSKWGVAAGLIVSLVAFRWVGAHAAEPQGHEHPAGTSSAKTAAEAKAGEGAKKESGTHEQMGHEHPGHEHPGGEMMEHPGEPAKKPAPAPEPSDGKKPSEPKKESSQKTSFGAGDIKVAMRSHITGETLAGGGVFRIRDDREERDLELNFVKIHDPVREVDGRGYFACTDFSTKDGKNVYDIDFWLKPKGDRLVVTETVIHKKDGVARFTYENDRPVALN